MIQMSIICAESRWVYRETGSAYGEKEREGGIEGEGGGDERERERAGVRKGGREREKERGREGERVSERERESVCERAREREGERVRKGGFHGLAHISARRKQDSL